MNPAGQGQSKTAKARARRASRKPAEVLDPDDPEFDAKLDASIERAYERIEDELNRAIEDLDTFRAVPVRIGTGSARKYLRTCAYVPTRWQAVRIGRTRAPARIGTVDTNPHTIPHGIRGSG